MDKIQTHKIDFKKTLERIKDWNIPSTEKTQVKKFCKDYSSGAVTKIIGTASEENLDRYLRSLRVALENTKKLDKKGIEDFREKLTSNKIQYKNKNYSIRSKKAILDIYSKYLKWRFPSKNLELILAIKIKEKKKEPPFLTLEEVKKLLNACPDNRKRYFIALLFSSGARAEEFHNIRYSDLKLPEGNESFIEVNLRAEFSKTHGRTIKLYWPEALEGIRPFIREREAVGIKDDEPIFDLTYRGMVKWLNRLGKRVLGKSVNYHLFRHSCATWISTKMGRTELCIFFGWDFSSPMPDIYISRTGISLKAPTEAFEKTNFEKLKNKFSSQEESFNQEIDSLKSEVESLKQKMRNFL